MLTERQRQILWITLGLYNSDQRSGVQHFCAGVEDEPICLELVELGFMREHSPNTKMLFRLFSVTEAGKRALITEGNEAKELLTQIYKCDVCEKTKEAADFWWSIDIAPDSLRIDIMPFALAQEWLYDGQRFDLCGKQCTVTKLLELMGLNESDVLTLEETPKTLPISRHDRCGKIVDGNARVPWPEWAQPKPKDTNSRSEE